MNTTKLNFWVDSVIGIAFVLSLSSGFMASPVHGQMEFHVFVSLSMMLGAVVHLVLHRKWITAAIRPGKTPPALTINFWLNVLLGMSLVATFITGLGGHHALGRNPLHALAALSICLILIVHLLRHWKWITNAARKIGAH